MSSIKVTPFDEVERLKPRSMHFKGSHSINYVWYLVSPIWIVLLTLALPTIITLRGKNYHPSMLLSKNKWILFYLQRILGAFQINPQGYIDYIAPQNFFYSIARNAWSWHWELLREPIIWHILINKWSMSNENLFFDIVMIADSNNDISFKYRLSSTKQKVHFSMLVVLFQYIPRLPPNF